MGTPFKLGDVASALAMSEHLIQRYLSPDATLTNSEFARFQAKAKRLLTDAEAAGELTEESLAVAIDAEVTLSPHILSHWVAARFASYFEVKAFALAQAIPFETEVNLDP